MLYNLSNIPADTKFDLNLTYEVYEKDKLVKEDLITGISSTESTEDKPDYTIGLNLQDFKIRYLMANESGFSSGSYDIAEDLNSYCSTFLVNDIYLNLNTETYIYYATDNSQLSTSIPLGSPIDENLMNSELQKNDTTILIKLSFKEL